MAEELTLTTPTTVPKTKWKLAIFSVNVLVQMLTIEVYADSGERIVAIYPTPAVIGPLGTLQPSGKEALSSLNTANNSAGTSMVKRILQRLQTDGYVGAGTVTGTPD
jgi:hypothetical protein